MEVDEPSQSGAAAAALAGRLAAGDDAYSKQQMQQLLGSAQRTTTVEGAAGAAKQPQQQHVDGHPVYGTPGGAAAVDASQKRVASGAKSGKDDKRQRKLESFFAVQKK